MNLANLLNSCICSAQVMVVKAQNALLFSDVNVSDLLNDSGAAKEGGALAPIDDQVKQYGGGLFSIVRNGVIYVAAIFLLVGAGALIVHAGNANKRDEAKSAFIWRLVGIILAFGAVSILLFAQKIGAALFPTA